MDKPQPQLKYRVGVDVGDRSVGLAFVEFNEHDRPVKLLRALTVRHDGGLDPSTYQSPQSRKATAGLARRVRRMRRLRRERLNELDNTLREAGFPLEDVSGSGESIGETYEPWFARARAVTEYIADDAERLATVSRAVRHMARHRGWRDPWLTFEQLSEVPTPTVNHLDNVASAREKLPLLDLENPTLGQLGAAAAKLNHILRPRTGSKKKGTEPITRSRVLQADELAELNLIMRTQRIDPMVADQLARIVFKQKRPHVPEGTVGKDHLPGMEGHNRSPIASLAYQEFRVRSTVANLRIRASAGSRNSELLDLEDLNGVSEMLLTWNAEDTPTWADVAEYLGVDPALLVTPTFEDRLLRKAPCDETTRLVEQAFAKHKKKTEVIRQWWVSASRAERELFVSFLTDPSDELDEELEQSGFTDEYIEWPEEARNIVQGLKFKPGRAAYSRESLQKLSDEMAASGVDLHTARKNVFGVDDSWKPKLPSIESQTGQPAVDRVLTIVRRAVMGAHSRWGLPEGVYIEHVRSGLMGAEARNKLQDEIRSNRRGREKVVRTLNEQGIDNPRDSEIRKYLAKQRQNCNCAYCGTVFPAKSLSNVELDHIVPRSGGGSNRRDNLVAVCRSCNAAKGKLPFAVFAESSKNPAISVEQVLTRMKDWKWEKGESSVRHGMIQRFKRKESDPEIDERSLESTSYAAVAIRQRIESYLTQIAEKSGQPVPKVHVFEGAVTREARRAGQIDKRILLRGSVDKDRFDTRHHAVDAAVMTLLSPSIVLTLRERSNMRRAHILTGGESEWREYRGRTSAAQGKFDKWRQDSYLLSDLLKAGIANDEIPVFSPLRLTERQGSVHYDKPEGLGKPILLRAEWAAESIKRICDADLYLAMQALVGKKGELPADSQRSITIGKRAYGPNDLIEVFKVAAPSIKVEVGSVGIGQSIHHARIYAWKDRKGELKFGMQRVFTAELPWFRKVSGIQNSFTVPIHPGSMSARDIGDRLKKGLEEFNAKYIGWIVENDEIEINPADFVDDSSELGAILRDYPERSWRIDGFPASRILRIRPNMLSLEGAPDDAPPVLLKVLRNGARVSVSKIISENVMICRRDALGNLRLNANSNLPVSWVVGTEARRILE